MDDSIARADDEDHLLLVAVADGTVVGFAGAEQRLHVTGQPEAYLGELVVAPAASGTGIGTALVAAVEDRARARALGCLTLETGSANTTAREL